MTGWKTADVTKKEVPDQKASIAVPLSFSVMIGRAIEREVASIAAARVTIQMETKARIKPLEGLNSGSICSLGVTAPLLALRAESVRLLESEGMVFSAMFSLVGAIEGGVCCKVFSCS